MKQIETDPSKLAAASQMTDESKFWLASEMRAEDHKREDYRLSVYVSRTDGSSARIFPGDTGTARRHSDGVTYNFRMDEVPGKVLSLQFYPPEGSGASRWCLALNSGDYLRYLALVSITPAPKSIEDCPPSDDQRRPEPGITVHKGASCGPTEGHPTGSIEQGFIVELREGASTVRFKVSREAERDELESFGGWYIHEEVGTIGCGDWSLMDSLGEFTSPGGAYRHLLCNGYGIPLTGIDPIPNSGFNLAPGME